MLVFSLRPSVSFTKIFRCIPNMLFYIIFITTVFFSVDIDAFLCFIYYTVMPIERLVFEHWQVFTCALRSWSRPSRPLKLGLCEWSEEMPSQLSVRYGVDRVSSAGRDGLNEQRRTINYTDKHERERVSEWVSEWVSERERERERERECESVSEWESEWERERERERERECESVSEPHLCRNVLRLCLNCGLMWDSRSVRQWHTGVDWAGRGSNTSRVDLKHKIQLCLKNYLFTFEPAHWEKNKINLSFCEFNMPQTVCYSTYRVVNVSPNNYIFEVQWKNILHK